MPKTDRTDTTQHTTSRDAVKNTRIKDSGAKLIFRDPVLCAQFLRGYTDIELLKRCSARRYRGCDGPVFSPFGRRNGTRIPSKRFI